MVHRTSAMSFLPSFKIKHVDYTSCSEVYLGVHVSALRRCIDVSLTEVYSNDYWLSGFSIDDIRVIAFAYAQCQKEPIIG